MKYLHRFIDIFWERDGFEVVELFGALVTLGMGIWIGHPFWDIFKDFPLLYSGMSSFAPEWMWGTFLFLVGMFRLWAILHDTYTARKIGILTAVVTWFFMAYFLTLTAPAAIATFMFFALAFFAIWEYVRLVRWNRRKLIVLARAHGSNL